MYRGMSHIYEMYKCIYRSKQDNNNKSYKDKSHYITRLISRDKELQVS